MMATISSTISAEYDMSPILHLQSDLAIGGLSHEDMQEVMQLEVRLHVLEVIRPTFLRHLHQIRTFDNVSIRVEGFITCLENLVHLCEEYLQPLVVGIHHEDLSQLVFNAIFCEAQEDAVQPLVLDYLHLTFQHFYEQSSGNTGSVGTCVSRMDRLLSFLPFRRLAPRVFHEPLKSFLQRQYRQLVTNLWEESHADVMLHFLKFHRARYLDPFLAHLFPAAHGSACTLEHSFLDNLACETFYVFCEAELFNLVRDYPESKSHLVALRYCIHQLHRRPAAMAALGRQLEQRLLHPGVSTAHILQLYVSAVNCFLLLDPSGKMLEVLALVATYLRDRADTVRCILDLLLRDNENVFEEELGAGHATEGECVEDRVEAMGEAVLQELYLNWTPEPVDNIYFTQLTGASCDLMSQLVNIYGNTDKFIKQFKAILAQRILSRSSFDTYTDLRHLEILKTRFGDENLHECQVMIQDIHSSKRMCVLLKEELAIANKEEEEVSVSTLSSGAEASEPVDFSAFILSDQFWPSMKEGKMNIPHHWATHLDHFKRQYERLKGNRTLVWQPHLGLVQMEVQLPGTSHGGTLVVEVPPVMAVALHHFSYRESWTVRELSTAMDVNPSTCRKACLSWEERGVLQHRPVSSGLSGGEEDTFVLCSNGGEDDSSMEAHRDTSVANLPFRSSSMVESRKGQQAHNLSGNGGEDETHMDTVAMAMNSDSEQKAQQEILFLSYIHNMLTNRGEMSLAQIHTVLRMFAAASNVLADFGERDIRRVLENKVRDGTLLVNGDKYRINPK